MNEGTLIIDGNEFYNCVYTIKGKFFTDNESDMAKIEELINAGKEWTFTIYNKGTDYLVN